MEFYFQRLKMKFIIVIVLLITSSVFSATVFKQKVTENDEVELDPDWWMKTVFYHIYPLSFKDSNGDGYGDIPGIIEKLEYLKETGIGAIILSSIFESPMVDFGYDVTDWYEVNPILGTNEDLRRLFEKAHELGIYVILDFVVNHTSDQHEWFKNSAERKYRFEKMYMWHSGIPDPNNVTGRNLPPNNWLSVYSGSLWTFNEVRNEYYIHQFSPNQPDLNYDDHHVVEFVEACLSYWLEQGADGFRIDSVNHMFEDLMMHDEPLIEGYEGELNRYESLEHIFTLDINYVYDRVRSWRNLVEKFVADNPGHNTKLIITDITPTILEWQNLYYGVLATKLNSHMPLNLALISDLGGDSTAHDFKRIIDERLANLPSWGTMNWVLGTHEYNRAASRYSANQVDALNILMMTLPGIPVTYNGEEIGMEDNRDRTWEETDDPAACQSGDPKDIVLTRDYQRSPFQWDDTVSAGFSSSSSTWLPVHKNYVDLNLKAQQSAERSHYKLYQQLIEIRKADEFQYGKYESAVLDNILVYTRTLRRDRYAVVMSFDESPSTADLTEINGFYMRGAIGTIVAITGDSTKSVGTEIDLTAIELGAYEAIIIHLTPVVEDYDPDWWKKTVYYQIYPRSFKDTTGDGIGDFQGIIQNMEHLKAAGVGAICLSSIFKSPMIDFGYDVEDFYDVDPIFGDMIDLRELFEKARELDIKIILDFVPNHTSDQHEWFQKSTKDDAKYADYYVWHDGQEDPENPEGRNLPPNNWLSVYSGSAWTFNEDRNQYYLHQFSSHQPDLNYRNPDVVQEMTDVLQFWIDFGVDGFRINAINHLFEDPLFQDEPSVEGYTGEPDHYASLRHIHTLDLSESLEMGQQWRKMLDSFVADTPGHTTKIILTEAYTDFENAMKWYGTENEPIAHIPFNFDLITELGSESTAEDFKEIIDLRISKSSEWLLTNWVQGTHDKNRAASRYSPQQVDALNTLVMTLPGIPIIYYGDEIGMEDNREITCAVSQDPLACQTEYWLGSNEVSRESVRTPFQWDNTTSAGFSTSSSPWVPVNRNYLENNLETQKNSEQSHFKYYQSLVALRDDEVFRSGDCNSFAENNVLCYSRTVESKTYVVVVNFDSEVQTIDVTKVAGVVDKFTNTQAEVILGTDVDAHPIGVKYEAVGISLEPFETVILSLSSAASVMTVSFVILAFGLFLIVF